MDGLASWAREHWGDVASLIGLAVSLATFSVSRRAKSAAEAARDAIERRTLGNELRDVGDGLRLLQVLCQERRWDLAGHICNRCAQQLAFARKRWTRHLGPKVTEAFGLMSSQLRTMHEQLRRFREQPPKQSELDRLERVVGKLNNILAEHIGEHESGTGSEGEGA